MKKLKISILLAALICLCTCNNTVQQKSNAFEQFTENPITITWKGDKNEVESFQANVMVFSMNNRKDTAATLNQTYRIAMSSANDRIHTRIDFDLDRSIPFRSVISDGENTIVFDPTTEEIGYRMHDPSALSPLNSVFGKMTSFSRVKLSLIREEAKRLSISMREENDGDSRILLLDLPPALLPKHGTDTIISSRIAFNINNETILETEVILKHEDDTIVKTTTTPVYEEVNGVPVKIGQITVIDSKAPGLLEGVELSEPIYNSLDDIPVLSEKEAAEMEKAGNLHTVSDMTFGDPRDLSYIETVYEVYDNIEINTTPEQLFRLLQK